MIVIKNPILKGFNPDPSICKKDGTYYIATSTFEWFPGVQIFESKDLKNWKLAVRPLNRVSQLDLKGVPDSGGVWAPHLSYEDGRFWLIYSIVREHRAFKDVRNYMVSAPDICGPWSEPVFLNARGFDPSLFHHPSGKKYILNMVYDFRGNRPWNYGIEIQEFDLKLGKLVGQSELIFKGTNLQKTEGPNLYFINNYYYLVTAEGGSQWGHSVTVARSKQLYGPYEVHPENPILTAWYSPENELQKTGHASLVKTDNEKWYMTFLTSRPIKRKGKGLFEERGFATLGRESAIAQLEWKNGWPYVVGGRTAQSKIKDSGLAEHIWEKNPEKVDFSSGISSDFQTLRVPFDSKMGEITAQGLKLYGQESLYSVFEQSLLARRFEALNFTASTAVSFEAEDFQQSAGLTCYYNSKNWTSFQVTYNEEKGRILTLLACEGSALSAPLCGSEIPLEENKKVELRVKVTADFYQFEYSFDSETWTKVPVKFDTYKLSDDYIAKPFLGPTGAAFTGAFVGVHCNDLTGRRKAAIFEYFTYSEE
ncbi:glycoside hydrolase family 43 protein [Lactovum odontotermitis]